MPHTVPNNPMNGAAEPVVASGVDDVNEVDAVLTNDGGDIWLGTSSSSTTSYAGLRFVNVTIPTGATITSARLEVVATATQWNRISFQFGMEAAAKVRCRQTWRMCCGSSLAAARRFQWEAAAAGPRGDDHRR